jgi:hypothetical protein
MVHKTFYKIYVPPSLTGPLLSYTHLLGHKGIKRMILDMQTYYFDNMQSVTRKFISCCWSCFLVNKGNKQVKLGIFHLLDHPHSYTLTKLVNTTTLASHRH